MAHKIRWAPLASDHFAEICENISKDSEMYAVIFAKKIMDIVELIPSFPKSGRIVPEYNNEKIREHFYGDYRVIYRLQGGWVEIAAICHGSRLLKNVM